MTGLPPVPIGPHINTIGLRFNPVNPNSGRGVDRHCQRPCIFEKLYGHDRTYGMQPLIKRPGVTTAITKEPSAGSWEQLASGPPKTLSCASGVCWPSINSLLAINCHYLVLTVYHGHFLNFCFQLDQIVCGSSLLDGIRKWISTVPGYFSQLLRGHT